MTTPSRADLAADPSAPAGAPTCVVLPAGMGG